MKYVVVVQYDSSLYYCRLDVPLFSLASGIARIISDLAYPISLCVMCHVLVILAEDPPSIIVLFFI